jgi:hypothetical protein
MDIATGNETLDGASLQASIAALEAMARALDADYAAAVGVDALQAIGAAQVALREREQALIDSQIVLLAGQVTISAAQVNAAAAYAMNAVARMATWKKRIDAIGEVVGFFVVVMTGDGGKILDAAIGLKAALVDERR